MKVSSFSCLFGCDLVLIDARGHPNVHQELTMKRHMQHWAQCTERRQTKEKHTTASSKHQKHGTH